MQGKIHYDFAGKLWQYGSSGGWYFVSLPEIIAVEIRGNFQWQEEGWGRMKVIARINNIEWNTAIWFDKKKNTYILPVKAEIRYRGKLQKDDILSVRIAI